MKNDLWKQKPSIPDAHIYLSSLNQSPWSSDPTYRGDIPRWVFFECKGLEWSRHLLVVKWNPAPSCSGISRRPWWGSSLIDLPCIETLPCSLLLAIDFLALMFPRIWGCDKTMLHAFRITFCWSLATVLSNGRNAAQRVSQEVHGAILLALWGQSERIDPCFG